MKQPFKTLLAAGTIAALSTTISNAFESDPFGYVAIDLKGDSDSRFSIPLVRENVFVGDIQSVNTGTNTITLSAADWTDGEFVFGNANNADVNNTYFAVVTTGTQNGAIFKITNNTGDTLTVEPALNDLSLLATIDADVTGDSISIHPYWTLAKAFEGITIPDGTQIFEYDNTDSKINKSADIIYTYFAGFNAWGDGVSPTAVDHTALLEAGRGYVMRTPDGSSDVELVVSGSVPMFNNRLLFSNDPNSSNDVTFALTTPVEVAIGDTNLNIQDGVQIFVYNNDTIASNKSADTILTYFAGFNAWGDGVSPTAVDDTFFLEPGNSYVLRKPTTTDAEVVETSFIPVYLQD